MKSIPKLLWLAMLIGLPIRSSPADISSTVASLESSTVTVITYDSKGLILAYGCGFFTTSKGDLISCRHVIEGACRAEILTSDGETFPVVKVIAEDKEGDLIRLSVDIPKGKIRVLSTTPVSAKPGEQILVVGPDNLLRTRDRDFLEGSISAIRDIQGFGTIIEITAPVYAGFSGSPVVNTEGNIIGVATFQIIGEEPVNFAVPAERINRLVPRLSETVALWETKRSQGSEIDQEEIYLKGVGLMWAEQWDQALACFEQIIECNPLYVVAYPQIGLCNLELGRWEDAIQAYSQVLKVDPDNADAYNNIAAAYGRLDDWGQALAAYKQAVRLDSTEALFFTGLGMSYGQLGNWHQAMVGFQKAVELDPDFADAHYGLGLSYWVVEETDKAWFEYHILKRLDACLAEDLLGILESSPTP